MRRLNCFVLILLFTLEVFAQSFPAGPVTVVVPLAPGDAADISARSMAEEMARRFGVWFSFLASAGIPEDARKALVNAIEQAAKLAPLGILQAYAPPETQAAEMREEFRRVTETAKKAGLTK